MGPEDEKTEEVEPKERKVVRAAQFCDTWMKIYKNGGTIKEVAEALDMRVDLVYARVSEYRTNGIKLPKLKRVNGTDAGPGPEPESEIASDSPIMTRYEVLKELLGH